MFYTSTYLSAQQERFLTRNRSLASRVVGSNTYPRHAHGRSESAGRCPQTVPSLSLIGQNTPSSKDKRRELWDRRGMGGPETEKELLANSPAALCFRPIKVGSGGRI